MSRNEVEKSMCEGGMYTFLAAWKQPFSTNMLISHVPLRIPDTNITPHSTATI